MDKIKILTDSTADLPEHIIKKYDIGVLPLLVSFGKETYKDGVDINTHTLLEKMSTLDVIPKTAQVTPTTFMEYYKKYIDEGYKILSIHLSSKMSGTYQSACIAKEALETDDIIIIDSLNVTSGLGLLVIKAAKLKDSGLGMQEIEKELLRLIPHVKSAIVFNSLDNLVKGGRLSKTAGVIGSILSIKPILAVENGEIVIIDKVRGSKKAIRTILDYIDEKGIKEGEDSLLLQIESKDVDVLREELKFRGTEFIDCQVGCVVGVHAGPDAGGIFFIEDF